MDVRAPAALALRLDPARDLQRLHALLVAHASQLDDRLHHHHHLMRPEEMTLEEREAEAVTLRDLQEAMYDLEHRHRVYRRSLARETKYGSKQAPIGDDNYLHLAGAAGNVEGPFLWRSWRSDSSPGVDLDGKTLPLRSSRDLASSTESLRLARLADERSSGKSNKSTGSGYLTMSCIKHEPSEDSDASAEKPARPPKPARLSPARSALTSPTSPLCEYVDVEPKLPERRPKPDLTPPRRPEPDPYRCKEYELMANFASHARLSDEDAPPAVPPRGATAAASRTRLQPKPTELESEDTSNDRWTPQRTPQGGSIDSLPVERSCHEHPIQQAQEDSRDVPPGSKTDAISTDDSLLDELQKNAYCILKVCEDEVPECASVTDLTEQPEDAKEYSAFSRVSVQRKSNPIKTQSTFVKPLKTSNSTSNVHDAGANTSKPLRLRTAFFLKKKTKVNEESATKDCARKEDNLIGRLTPRFGQSRLYGRGRSLELAPAPPVDGARTRPIERSATTVNIPTRPINSSIVANLKFFNLHRYGAQEEVQCHGLVRSGEADSHAHAPSLLAATSDIRL